MKRPSGFKPTDKGQSLIEFAFAFPIFLGLLIGLMAFAVLFYSYVTLNLAVREGAGVIVRCPSLNCDTPRLNNGDRITSILGVQTYVKEKSFSLNIGEINVLVEPSNRAHWVIGAQVSVSATYNVPLPTVSIPILGNTAIRLGTLQIYAQSVMTIE